MQTARATAVLCCLLAVGAAAGEPPARGQLTAPSNAGGTYALDAEGCVKVALHRSGQAAAARGELEVYQARLDAVTANLYPKLTALSLLAPAYTVRGNGYDRDPEVRYRSIRDWGPFASFESRLVQPVSTFGRIKAGRQAARERLLVEQNHVREVEQGVARQVRHLYYTHLYVKSLAPALLQAKAFVAQALVQAQRLSEGGSGEVHQSDLGRLVHGQSELLRRIDEADEGAALSLYALKQAVGLEAAEPLLLADERLPMPPAASLGQFGDLEAPLPELPLTGAADQAPARSPYALQLQLASANRPEWQQVLHGQRAALALERSERAAMLPRLLFVGQFAAAWTPTREHDRNPWHYDIYNRLAGGAALVLQLDLDVAQAHARAREAAAQGAQVRALERYAQTGIPLEVRQAFEGLRRAQKDLAASEEDVVASRRWFTFAKAALQSGTGEARDLLEGLVAYLQAKQAHLGAALAWWAKLADLAHATGAATPPWLPPKNSVVPTGRG